MKLRCSVKLKLNAVKLCKKKNYSQPSKEKNQKIEQKYFLHWEKSWSKTDILPKQIGFKPNQHEKESMKTKVIKF